MKKCLILSILLLVNFFLFEGHAQDQSYVSKLVKELSSQKFHGRGYVKNGDQKAAAFLSKEMRKSGLTAFTKDYFQTYSFSVNTFPGELRLEIDGKSLKAGSDYAIHPSARSIEWTYKLQFLADTTSKLSSVYAQSDTNLISPFKMLVLPDGMKNYFKSGISPYPALAFKAKGKPWWFMSGGKKTSDRIILKVVDSLLLPDAQQLSLKLENEYLTDHKALNVCGYVKGTVQPDSSFIFVAHYDHLGMMGVEALYPGASDNASGTATVLDLGRFYAAHPEKAYYTMVFLLVSGEETGLYGSSYFAENPLVNLDKTKFVINLDMVGTGSEGLSVMNGEQIRDAAAILLQLNDQKHYFADIRLGGESCNSDHCPFYKKGVPAFFLFTRGSENHEYHTVTDTYDKLPFTAYPQLFGILTDFVEALQTKADYR